MSTTADRLRARYLVHTSHREAENKEPIFFRVHLFSTWQKPVNFFTYTYSRSISYNSVYLISACVENSAATVTLNIVAFTSQVMITR